MSDKKKAKNSLRSKIIRFLWKTINTEKNKDLRFYSKLDHPFKDKEVKIEDLKIKKSMEICKNFDQHEYIVKLPFKTLIEPDYGWVIKGFNNIFMDSLPYGTENLPPSFKKLIKTRLFNRNNIKKEDLVISLRDTSEASYFHFYNDVLNKIILLDDFNIDKNIPLIISKKLYQKRFFQDILNRCSLKDRKWIVQDNYYIETKEVIYCKTLPHDKNHYEKLLNLLNIPEPNLNANKRIFLTRDPSKGRSLENIDEIIEIAKNFDFEIIDTENMSLDDQINLFSSCRSVIGLHGAGLTNVIFRRGAPLSLLEIFQPDNIPPHYYWLALIFNYKYDGILGSYNNLNKEVDNSTPLKRSYYLNPGIFTKKLEKLEKERFF
ncbi:MAG: glycosyltransferase family 61 protein [Candidatus Humimicrobiaceae bacterium]